jgi:hypothetical protein
LRSRADRRPRRLRVCGLILLLLASRIAVELHWAVARHAVCPQHGELIEVPAEHSTAAHRAQDERPVLQPGPTAEGAHEHCPFALAIREHPLTSKSAQILVAAPEQSFAPSTTDPSQPWQPFPRFLLSPHTSPPA